MILLSILDIKEFMNTLLRTDTFDSFLLSEGSITTYMTYLLDGHPRKDFFSPEDEPYELVAQEPFIPFSLIRPACFDLIKGKRTPISFRFVFLLSSENQKRTIASIGGSFSSSDVSGMYLNLKYQEQKLICTTGVSYQIFSMDKSLEHAWDDMVKRFFQKHQIAFEVLS
ncbi:MAG: hypothetical protein HFH41_06145 [Lachnospiraceae bacterium]|nr:hypothetical protein [Lachnospiraceae bacterium]